MNTRVLGVIPARLGSTRLPEKPLKEIHGQTLLERVYRQAKQAKTIGRVIIATDSDEISKVALGFGAEVMMTPVEIRSGSERVAAVVERVGLESVDLVVNIQGDMPFLSPEIIDSCVLFMERSETKFDMGTIASPILDEAAFLNQNTVKVVTGVDSSALYFSRAPIPCSRDGRRPMYRFDEAHQVSAFGLKHFGLYVYRPHILGEFRKGEAELEEIERLEQLRLLERGLRIGVCLIDSSLTADYIEVDTEEDLIRARLFARHS